MYTVHTRMDKFNYRGEVMDKGSLRIYEIVTDYLKTVPQDSRSSYESELSRFMHWFGRDRGVDELNTREVESYQEYVTVSGANQERRLRPFKEFLAFLQTKKHLSDNLSKYIRLKRTTTTRRTTSGGGSIAVQDQRERISRDGYDKLQSELNERIEERQNISKMIEEARRDKDIRENAGFHAAKEAQSLNETRIQQLQQQLARAEIMDSDSVQTENTNRINIGATVILLDIDAEESVEYTLVSAMEANVRIGKISIASPMGRSMMDKKVGDEVDVEAPMGIIKYRVKSISY